MIKLPSTAALALALMLYMRVSAAQTSTFLKPTINPAIPPPDPSLIPNSDTPVDLLWDSVEIYADTKYCKAAQVLQLQQAWADAKKLAEAIGAQEYPEHRLKGYDYDTPMAQWFGKGIHNDHKWYRSHRQKVHDNLRRLWRLYNYRNSTQPPSFPIWDPDRSNVKHRIYWYCYNDRWEPDDIAKFCAGPNGTNGCCKTGVDAGTPYAVDAPVTVQNTVFCPSFFTKRSLNQVIEMNKDKPSKKNLETFYQNKGWIMLAETLHYHNLVVTPAVVNILQSPLCCWQLASRSGIWKTPDNTDNYVSAAMAMYVQQALSLPSPPKPRRCYDNPSDCLSQPCFEGDPNPPGEKEPPRITLTEFAEPASTRLTRIFSAGQVSSVNMNSSAPLPTLLGSAKLVVAHTSARPSTTRGASMTTPPSKPRTTTKTPKPKPSMTTKPAPPFSFVPCGAEPC